MLAFTSRVKSMQMHGCQLSFSFTEEGVSFSLRSQALLLTLFERTSYVEFSTAGMSGADLVHEAGGGIVAVEIEYRLGIFGEMRSPINHNICIADRKTKL